MNAVGSHVTCDDLDVATPADQPNQLPHLHRRLASQSRRAALRGEHESWCSSWTARAAPPHVRIPPTHRKSP